MFQKQLIGLVCKLLIGTNYTEQENAVILKNERELFK